MLDISIFTNSAENTRHLELQKAIDFCYQHDYIKTTFIEDIRPTACRRRSPSLCTIHIIHCFLILLQKNLGTHHFSLRIITSLLYHIYVTHTVNTKPIN